MHFSLRISPCRMAWRLAKKMKEQKLIDSHAHLLDERFDEDRAQLIEDLSRQMEAVIECASAPEDFERILELTRRYPLIYGAVGVHPESVDSYTQQALERIEHLLEEPKILAIGEIGLDYHWEPEKKERQKEALCAQMELAGRLRRPVVLHSRDATADMLALLGEFPGQRGVLHCFSGSVDTARELLNRGYYLGFGGTLTFSNNRRGVEVAAYAPLDRILIETDSPYLAPVPVRGTRNNPANTRYVAKRLAEIKGISREEVILAANANARELFGF